jgi:hypothetical protein
VGDVHEDRKEALEDVAQGQKREDLIVEFDGVVPGDGPRHPGHVAVGQHGPLGRARGARGVNQYGQVVGLHEFHAPGKGARVLLQSAAARLEQGLKCHDHGILELLQSFQIPYDDLAQGGGLLPEHEPLVQLLLVFHEKKGGLGVIHDVLHLLPGIGGIDAHGNAPGALHRHIGPDPLGAVVPDDAHAFPGP